MKLTTMAGLGLGLAALVGGAQASLVNRGGGMIYDTTRNITWLADMNYAATQYAATGGAQGDADGYMTWDVASAWAESLVYGGYSDWRLPTLNPLDTTCSSNLDPGGGFPLQYFGTGCTGGELSGLFVTDLGNRADESVLDQAGDTDEQIANLALFSNVQSSVYWSGTVYAPRPTVVWDFYTNAGFQSGAVKRLEFHAVAVRPGDVNVPEPQTLALTLLAAGAGALVRRRWPGSRG